jgi:hypothetical protein
LRDNLQKPVTIDNKPKLKTAAKNLKLPKPKLEKSQKAVNAVLISPAREG